jgi:hypothetical protein
MHTIQASQLEFAVNQAEVAVGGAQRGWVGAGAS